MKYLKKFAKQEQFNLFKDSEEFILPNVTYIVNDDIVLYNSVPFQEPEQTFMLRAKYNATPDNLLAFNGAQNVKSLKVNGNSITIEPIKNENTTFDVLGENISLDMETGEATLPESYLIKSPVTSWSFKVKDPNYVINENTYACMLGMVDGMAFAQPMPLEEAMSYALTTNDGVTFELVDTFLTYMNTEIQSGMQIGYTLCDMDMDSETLVFIDTEHQTNAPTGGLPTYSFDSEGLYDVEIELADPVIRMQFAGTPLISIEIGSGVTSIDGGTFQNCSGLTSINIPDSVTSIGDSAFFSCTGLTSIVIPDSVTSIGKWTFRNCTGLTSIVIPDSVTSIGYGAFESCSGLASINIPDSVTEIGERALWYCSGLTGITIGSGVTSIGAQAFMYCSGLTSIVIPDSVTSIDYQAFYGCSGLTEELVIPNSVTSIGWSAFQNCSELTGVTIGSGVTSIDGGTFQNCSGLTSINIPDSVISIGDNAFFSCTGLTSIVIPESVTSIGYQAFYYCSGLTDLTIGSGVTSIGGSAFNGCTGLGSITCLAPTAPSVIYDTFYDIKPNGTLYVPLGSDYSSWMSTGDYYLGSFNWTIQNI